MNVDYNNGIYYIVGYNPATTDDELNAYCFGTLSIPTGISFSAKNDSKFIISPNPTRQELFLTNLPEENLQIQILDLQGRVLFSQKSTHQSKVLLPIYNLSSGIYLISVQAKHGIQTKKFVKN